MLFTIMNSFKKTLLLSALVALFVAAFTSCREDSIFSPEPSEEGMAGGITFRCSDMLETFVGENNPAGTRAAASKNPEEKAINTLHVFFFDYETGALLETEEYDNFNSYQKVSNTNFIKIPTGEGVSETFKNNFKSVHIVAIANIDATDEAADYTGDANKFYTKYSTDGRIQKAGRDAGGEVHEIDNYSKLKEWIYYPRIRMNEDGSGDISKLPDAGMPMIGELGNKDLDQKAVDLSERPANTIMVNLTALMAKVNVSVKLDPDQSTDQWPLLKITGYGVRNMPIAVPFVQPTCKVKSGVITDSIKPTSYHDYFERYDVTTSPMYHKKINEIPDDATVDACDDSEHEFLTDANVMINKDSEAVTFSYYTFENINLPDYNAKRAKPEYSEEDADDAFNDDLTVNYPAGIREEDKQRWKSTFAYSDRASAMILKGQYTNHQGLTYNAQFTVYLGCTVGVEDPNIDFRVKRNHQYDNNVVIHGLDYIRNSSDEVYNFDGRVNVVDENPFYLAIVNERKVDAHATALPMDVWFMLREAGNGNVDDVPWNSEIKFTIRNHDTKDGYWLRMEKVTREEMASDDRPTGGLPPFYAGKGARKYFTTDLVTNTLKDNWEMTIDGDTDGSRSRIYFYIDENVPANDDVNTTDKTASNYYGDRTATIDIVYTRTDEHGDILDKRERSIEIEQRALLKVSGTWTGNDNSTDDIKTTWMEYYEEYLAHNDPLDRHEMPGEFYTGLPWGLRGKVVYTANFFSSDFAGRFKNPEGTNIEYFYRVYYKIGGFAMTEWAINKSGKSVADDVKLFNTKEPTSAFHYCFGKNKRNNQGVPVVSSSNNYQTAKGWYMPGIRELEKALVDYYGIFPEFRGNYYWSAACAESGNNNARATKVIMNGDKPKYENSGTGDNGCIDRDKSLRIRAFYRVD